MPPRNQDIDAVAPASPLLRAPRQRTSNASDPILRIAKAQKGVLRCVLANVICFIIPFAYLLVLPFQMFYIYRLAEGLGSGAPWLWCLGMFIPFVSLILLLILSQKATGAISAAGFKVGLMGANLNEILARTRMA